MSKSDNVAGFSGETLKELMKSHKMSNTDLAKKLDIDRIPTISEWRNGTVIPDKNHLTELARVFDVSENYFYSGSTTEVKDAILFERENSVESVFDKLRSEASLDSLFEEDYLSVNNPDVVYLIGYLRCCGYEVNYLAKPKGKLNGVADTTDDEIDKIKEKLKEKNNEVNKQKKKLKDREFERIQLEYIKAIDTAGKQPHIWIGHGEKSASKIKNSLKMREIIDIYNSVLFGLKEEEDKRIKDSEDTKKRIYDGLYKYKDEPMTYEYILKNAFEHLRGQYWDRFRKELRKVISKNAERQLSFLNDVLEEPAARTDSVIEQYLRVKKAWLSKGASSRELSFDEDRYKAEYNDVYSKHLLAEYDKTLDYYYGLCGEIDFLEDSRLSTEDFFMKDYRNLYQVLEAKGCKKDAITGIINELSFAVRIRKDGKEVLVKLDDFMDKSCSVIPEMVFDVLKTSIR